MSQKLKHALAQFTPPIVLAGLRRMRGRDDLRGQSVMTPGQPEWEAVPDTDAVWTAAGWAHPSIAQIQREKWDAFLASVSAPEPLAVSHEASPGTAPSVGPHNAIMTFGYVLGRAFAGRAMVSVLDWGGGLGHYEVYARSLYPNANFDYTIKDLDSLCIAGRELLPRVNFTPDQNQALSRQYDLIFASSALHYTRAFYPLLDRICASVGQYLMITRLPVIRYHSDFVVVQRPHQYGYHTEYPCWFVNRQTLIEFVEQRGLRLEREFLLDERPFVVSAPEQCVYSGFLFERKV